MIEFLSAVFSFPTAIFTALLGVSFVYWGAVIVGAADIDLFSGGAEGALEGGAEGALEGAAEGALEGAAEGALEGAAEGALEGAAEGAFEGAAEGALEGAEGVLEGGAEGALDGVADGAADGALEAVGHGHDGALEGASHGSESALAYVLSALGLRKAPVTVVFSVFSVVAWALSFSTSLLSNSLLGSLLPAWLLGISVLLLVLPLSVFATSLAIKPLGPLFVHDTSRGHHSLVGKTVFITTGSADHKFGQASLQDEGRDLILQVRCGENVVMQKNEEALVVEYRAKDDVYVVEPMSQLLGDGS